MYSSLNVALGGQSCLTTRTLAEHREYRKEREYKGSREQGNDEEETEEGPRPPVSNQKEDERDNDRLTVCERRSSRLRANTTVAASNNALHDLASL